MVPTCVGFPALKMHVREAYLFVKNVSRLARLQLRVLRCSAFHAGEMVVEEMTGRDALVVVRLVRGTNGIFCTVAGNASPIAKIKLSIPFCATKHIGGWSSMNSCRSRPGMALSLLCNCSSCRSGNAIRQFHLTTIVRFRWIQSIAGFVLRVLLPLGRCQKELVTSSMPPPWCPRGLKTLFNVACLFQAVLLIMLIFVLTMLSLF